MAVDVVIGRNVHHLMWEKRIQHRAIYEALGLTRGSLSKKLRGEVAWSAQDVAAAAEVLHVQPGDLYEGAVPVQRGAQVTGEKVERRRLALVS